MLNWSFLLLEAVSREIIMVIMVNVVVKIGFDVEGCAEMIAICTVTDAFVLAVVDLPV